MKNLRQAIQVSPIELRKIADGLEKELTDINKIGITMKRNQKFLVPIINKQPECSDTWEFEK